MVKELVKGFGGFSYRRMIGGVRIPADGKAPKLPLAWFQNR
jgi:TfoX/Sxy family transcriptional regulator of competence genes